MFPLTAYIEAALEVARYDKLDDGTFAGDSFNDTAMLLEAHVGFLFRAPVNVKQQFPQFQAVETYAELLKLIKAEMK